MNEIDAVIEVTGDESTNIWSNTNGSIQGKGDIGELFCRRAIKQCFFDKGYNLRATGNETFAVYKEDKKFGGPDFIIDFTDSNGKTYNLLLEVKNFKHYKNGISPSNYQSWILNKFTKIDNKDNRQYYWAVAINKRNIKYIWKHCGVDKINIIPIAEHLTDQHINKQNLQPIFDKFEIEFNDFINKIMVGWIKK